MKRILSFKNRKEFYDWLNKNHLKEKECFVVNKMGEPKDDGNLYYLDAVEVALCFGWIDSTKFIINKKLVQRFSPRRNDSNWTVLNIARVKRLIKLGDMTKYGSKVCKDLNKKYIQPKHIIDEIKKDRIAYKFFNSRPKLYQNVKLYNLNRFKGKELKEKLDDFIKKCHEHKMVGSYNDYGRLD